MKRRYAPRLNILSLEEFAGPSDTVPIQKETDDHCACRGYQQGAMPISYYPLRLEREALRLREKAFRKLE